MDIYALLLTISQQTLHIETMMVSYIFKTILSVDLLSVDIPDNDICIY